VRRCAEGSRPGAPGCAV